MIGARLGNWTIEAEVAQNDMGRLFRARAADASGRAAAVRWLTHPKAKTAEFEKLFLAQVELLRKLKHPGIVAVLEGGMHDGSPYCVMDWVDGSDLQTLLRRGERPAWADVLAMALRIVPALRHAHRRNVLHRDLKPSNLFRGVDGTVKLSDFGIIKFFGDALLTNADNPLGSAAYLSPEQAAGKPHTKRSDFYSLGCLLWTLVVGRAPFTGSTVVELTHKHCFVLAERPIHFVPDLPEEFDRLVMRLLAKEPAQRPGSGTLLVQELEGIWSVLERRGQVGPRPVAPAFTREESESGNDDEPAFAPRLPAPIPREPAPWQRRWYIVGPLFAACVLLLAWAFWFRGPSAADLMAGARPLLESNKPADWERAWQEYLEPLSRKFPGQYREEIEQAKRKIEEHGELQRAFVVGKSAQYRSQAERFYHEGLRLLQAGEFAAARRVLENLVLVYYTIEEEKRWVVLAKEAIGRIDAHQGTNPRPPADDRLEQLAAPVVREVERLRAAGRPKDADALAQALEFLYRDDPEIESLRRLLRAPGKK